MDTPTELLTTSEVAKWLGVSDDTVRTMCAEGQLEAYRPSERGWYRIDAESVRRWFESRRVIPRSRYTPARRGRRRLVDHAEKVFGDNHGQAS